MRIAAVVPAAAGVASKATVARRAAPAARFVHRAAQPCIFTANAKPAWRRWRQGGRGGGGLERRPHCTNCCGYCLARKRNYYIKDT